MAKRESPIGRRYLLGDQVVTLLLTWRGRAPHNVLIEYADGKQDCRPMRGLRRVKDGATT